MHTHPAELRVPRLTGVSQNCSRSQDSKTIFYLPQANLIQPGKGELKTSSKGAAWWLEVSLTKVDQPCQPSVPLSLREVRVFLIFQVCLDSGKHDNEYMGRHNALNQQILHSSSDTYLRFFCFEIKVSSVADQPVLQYQRKPLRETFILDHNCIECENLSGAPSSNSCTRAETPACRTERPDWAFEHPTLYKRA